MFTQPVLALISARVSGLGGRSRIVEMYVGELLPVVVLHDEIGFAFLNRPGRREAAGGIFLYFDQPQNDQQNSRADEGVNDRTNNAARDYNADTR